MKAEIQEIFDILFGQRYLSWPIVVIAYLVVTLILRKVTFSGMRSGLKHLEKKVFKGAKRGYQKNSFFGWLVYLLSVLVLIFYWFQCALPYIGKIPNLLLVSVFLILFFASFILHLRALFFSTIHAMEENLVRED